MKVAILHLGSPSTVEGVEWLASESDDVYVRMAAGGFCCSDWHMVMDDLHR